MIKKVLFILTSHDEIDEGGGKTGFMLNELAGPFFILLDKGINITLASPKGGQLAINPDSYAIENYTTETDRFNAAADSDHKLAHSFKICNLQEIDFDALFYPGGLGTIWDLSTDIDSIHLMEAFYRNNKPIALVGLATAALEFATNTLGEPLVKGKSVTGFSIDEVNAMVPKTIAPILIEKMLLEQGATFSKLGDKKAYAVIDGILITGQNAGSSQLVAEKLFELLEHIK